MNLDNIQQKNTQFVLTDDELKVLFEALKIANHKWMELFLKKEDNFVDDGIRLQIMFDKYLNPDLY
jgi:hypothetical protein